MWSRGRLTLEEWTRQILKEALTCVVLCGVVWVLIDVERYGLEHSKIDEPLSATSRPEGWLDPEKERCSLVATPQQGRRAACSAASHWSASR
ncbi:hypothetical protein N431DRAFT_187015 [Stipitochalara longipes BDJ]|nr:hypothetical protein N431DRAFT_187015 [Stipitochalara longipes BDJ]